MRLLLTIITLFTLTFLPSFAKKDKQVKVKDTKITVNNMYAFGYAVSFADSTIYLTEIHKMPEVQIYKKTKFLERRGEYSAHLKHHFDSIGKPHLTCAIIFDQSEAKLRQKFVKLTEKVQKQKRKTIKAVPAQEFTFKPLVQYEDE